ncbi:MAG: tRNA 4-thiouridine(8) synthase ThiI [Candidatus Pacebacteria bacterium]|nr:tRNA 4-thiouridine(8) synthase ThiI [Candidatus Paceibacterota bacterium]
MPQPVVLIHHREIALKGQNRFFFENKLLTNLKKSLQREKIKTDSGRIVIKLDRPDDLNPLIPKLNSVFGVADFCLAWQVEKDLIQIQKAALGLISKLKSPRSFRITTRRGDKNFPLTSFEVNRKLGYLIKQKANIEVNLKNPEVEVFVEIAPRKTYLYLEKKPGPGGLPVSTAGRVLTLLSGGIDSPVAAWLMLKRGARVDFVHFHSYPQTGLASINKVKKLARILNQFQFQTNLFLVPFLDFQKKAYQTADNRLLVILYRRTMFRISQKIALKKKYLGLVTGENLGQVASQTLENLAVIGQAIKLPLYQPLIAYDKQEIVNLAKKIGTFETSIQPHQDCCSLFVPRHPFTKAKLENVLAEEKKLDIKSLAAQMLSRVEKKIIK